MATPQAPSQLIAALSRLMKKYPAYAGYVKTSRDAILGALSAYGVHGLIIRAIANGANTIEDIEKETGYSFSYVHTNLKQLIKLGLVESTKEPVRGNFRPRNLFFLTKKEVSQPKP